MPEAESKNMKTRDITDRYSSGEAHVKAQDIEKTLVNSVFVPPHSNH